MLDRILNYSGRLFVERKKLTDWNSPREFRNQYTPQKQEDCDGLNECLVTYWHTDFSYIILGWDSKYAVIELFDPPANFSTTKLSVARRVIIIANLSNVRQTRKGNNAEADALVNRQTTQVIRKNSFKSTKEQSLSPWNPGAIVQPRSVALRHWQCLYRN